MSCTIPVSVVRGGTSRGVFLCLRDLPRGLAERDALCVALIGSPDPLAVDGLGGGASSNSKIMAVGLPSEVAGLPQSERCPDDVDLVTMFAQVDVHSASVDWGGNCGNLSAAVSAYALDEGLLDGHGDSAVVRVWNMNTDSVFEVKHPLEHGRLPSSGDFRIPGVQAPAARIDLNFLEPGGEHTGSIFPRGRVTHLPGAGVEVSLLDVINPVVLVRAQDLDADVTQTREQLNQQPILLERLEGLRREAGELMGIQASAAIPRVACVGAGFGAADVQVRMTSMGIFHHAIPVTGALALGAAMELGGTVIDDVFTYESKGDFVISQPSGLVTVTASAHGDGLDSVGLARTARIILKGSAFVA